MARDRNNNRIPKGLSFLMWPALVRAPWLLPSFTGEDLDHRQGRQHDEARRRRHDR
jgi:hypothetical protein